MRETYSVSIYLNSVGDGGNERINYTNTIYIKPNSCSTDHFETNDRVQKFFREIVPICHGKNIVA